MAARLDFLRATQTAAAPNLSVFINCPYDKEFRPVFDAIIFATVACGFIPRSALETETMGLRIPRILDILFSSRYSIHDLSRCRGEGGDENLARFNMPLEFGFAMARKHVAPKGKNRHDWLLLVPEQHDYAKFASDLKGFDPKKHDGTKQTVVPFVINWLRTRYPDAKLAPFAEDVLEREAEYSKSLATLQTRSGGNALWQDIFDLAQLHAKIEPRRVTFL